MEEGEHDEEGGEDEETYTRKKKTRGGRNKDTRKKERNPHQSITHMTTLFHPSPKSLGEGSPVDALSLAWKTEIQGASLIWPAPAEQTR